VSRQQTRLSALYFEKVSPRLLSITSVVVVVLTIVGVRSYVAWQRGDDFRILGVGVMRRFPCADYPVPHSGYGTIRRSQSSIVPR